ncbi:MAG: hypothetical protein KBB75_01980 [Candidatus Pacebacteria bacterium]|nr:hypothetical protein [Candidatus Paceibacterota bacterium]MBP9815601.1 hypothetical protein [Candidatus Levybacteria bacterium]
MSEKFNNPNIEKTPGEKLLEHDYLIAGKSIKLVKVFNPNETIEGVLDVDVKIGKPIILDEGLKNTDPIMDVKYENDKIFFKTNSSTYELVPPTNAVVKTKLDSIMLAEKGEEIEELLKVAQSFALSGQEKRALFNKKIDLFQQPRTPEIQKELDEITEKLKKCTVVVQTLLEYKILMEKTGKNYYIVRGVVEHENAHANKASSLDAIHGGYSLIVSKNEKGGFSYQPTALTGSPDSWDEKRKIETNIKIGSAPKEYGDRLSPSDEKQIAILQERLKNL